jgi:uncharacterized iron-regulated protein
MAMNKNNYLSLALAACMGITSSPLMAKVLPAPEQPANNTATAESPASHKEQAAYHKAMVEHYKSLIAAEYEKGGEGDSALKKNLEVIAAHHEALSTEYQKAAGNREAMVEPK